MSLLLNLSFITQSLSLIVWLPANVVVIILVEFEFCENNLDNCFRFYCERVSSLSGKTYTMLLLILGTNLLQWYYFTSAI